MLKQLFEQARQSLEAGKLDHARSLCDELLDKADPPPVSVIELLCQIEHQAGRFDVALKHSDVLVKIKPDHVEHRSNRAALLGFLGRFAEAAAEYQHVLKLAPDHVEANLNLGSAYLRMSVAREATRHLERVVKKFPDLPRASFQYAKALVALGDYQRSLLEIERGHRLSPGDLEIAMMFAELKATTGDVEGAIALYRQLLTLHPDRTARINLALGNAYGYRGDSKRAALVLKECLDIDPENYAAARSLTLHEKTSPDSLLAKRLIVQMRDDTLRNLQKSQIAFALGSIYDGSKAFDKASAYFRAGNRLLRRSLKEEGAPAELPVHQQTFDTTRSILGQLANVEVAAESVTVGDASFEPVFIVGMPRSGSTMTEQIIGAHSAVASAGEVAYLSAAFSTSGVQGLREGHQQVELTELAESLRQFAGRYRQQLSLHRKGAAFITDKWLYNFLRVGLIRKVFPHAKIIWCLRDHRDCAVSIFNTYFARGHRYTTSFEDIAALYCLHDEALEYWQNAIPGQFYIQSYELMVASPESEIPKLLDYCDLAHEAACFNFHQRNNSVLTASMMQVRRPINADSVARWKRYPNYQPELDNALNRHGLLTGAA